MAIKRIKEMRVKKRDYDFLPMNDVDGLKEIKNGWSEFLKIMPEVSAAYFVKIRYKEDDTVRGGFSIISKRRLQDKDMKAIAKRLTKDIQYFDILNTLKKESGEIEALAKVAKPFYAKQDLKKCDSSDCAVHSQKGFSLPLKVETKCIKCGDDIKLNSIKFPWSAVVAYIKTIIIAVTISLLTLWIFTYISPSPHFIFTPRLAITYSLLITVLIIIGILYRMKNSKMQCGSCSVKANKEEVEK